MIEEHDKVNSVVEGIELRLSVKEKGKQEERQEGNQDEMRPKMRKD